MDDRMQSQDEQRHDDERAAEWLTRLKIGQAYDKRAFVRWLRRSPKAVGEMLLATSTDIVLRQLFRDRPVDIEQFGSAASNVIRFHDQDPPAAWPRSRRKQWTWMAGLGVGLAAAAAVLIIQPPFVRDLLHPNVYTTSVGEQRSIELMDGSAISINAQSSVRVDFSEKMRDVYLTTGQAMFTVARDTARPFRVHVGRSVVQAVGTKFDVRHRSDRINVSVVEGTVQISAEAADARVSTTLTQLAELTRVTAGEAVSIVDTGQVTAPAPINVADVSAWQQRRLVFSDSTLAEIAEEFARYNRTPHLRIEGDALRGRRLSGVFDADSPDTLLIYLGSDNTIAFDRRDDEIVIRLRPVTVQSGSDQG